MRKLAHDPVTHCITCITSNWDRAILSIRPARSRLAANNERTLSHCENFASLPSKADMDVSASLRQLHVFLLPAFHVEVEHLSPHLSPHILRASQWWWIMGTSAFWPPRRNEKGGEG